MTRPKAGKNTPPIKSPLFNPANNVNKNGPRYGGREVKNKKLPVKKTDEGSGPNKSGQAGKGRGSGGGGNLVRTAKRLTNGVVRDEVRDLNQQRREVVREARNATDVARVQYKRGVGDLEHVFGETGEYIAGQNAQSQAGFNVAAAEQSAASAALQSQLQNVYAAGEGSATAEMSRLGITGAEGSGGFLTQLQSDSANAQATGAMTSSNNAANLSMAQGNAGAVGSLLSGMNQGSYMGAIGQNLNARNTAFADTRQARSDQLALVREAVNEAQGSRKDTFFALLQQLKQTGWTGGGGGGGPRNNGGSKPTPNKPEPAKGTKPNKPGKKSGNKPKG